MTAPGAVEARSLTRLLPFIRRFPPRSGSMRARLTLGFMLVTGLLMTCACGALITYSYVSAQTSAHSLLKSMQRDALQSAASPNTPTSLRAWLRQHSTAMDAADVAAVLIGRDGRMLRRTQRSVPSWPRTDDGWEAVAVESQGETLVIGYPWRKTEAALRSQALLLCVLALCMLVVTGAASWALVGQTLLPIRLLSRQAQVASTDNLRLRLEAPTDDVEVTELVNTLNGLLARISDTAAARGRFYAAASHELRTPLQALSGHLELALNRDRGAAEYRAMLEEARVQTKRLTTLARDLLFLNRLETGAVPEPEPVETSELCERLLTHFQPLAARRQLSLQIRLTEEAMIEAPPLHVEMLIRNLIENSIKYATPGGVVAVTLAAVERLVRLEVFNTFPAEPRLDRDQLFEPFHRPDASRTDESGGNGLGLAICGALTSANRWRMDWLQSDDGVHATVWFPAAG